MVNIGTLCLLLLLLFRSSECSDQTWDVLIFTQHWPITVCTVWEESKGTNNCTLPPKENLWTIHGIWPTKVGTHGPNFCNKSSTFNPKLLEPILPELELYWMNIEANTPLYSLWKHEWLKHGTCAAELPTFGNELSYFQKGLEWVKEYNMHGILARNRIVPSDEGYTVDDIFYAIKQNLNKSVIVECVVEQKTKYSLISEVRLCFDRNLTLIDCNSVYHEGFYSNYYEEHILTNCDLKRPVKYWNKLPTISPAVKKRFNYMDRLYNAYQLIRQIIWATI